MPDPRQEFPNSLRSRYLEPSFVGEGAMGQVFRVRDSALDSIVAIKILARGAEEQDLIRLQREAKTLAQLNHPNIVRVLDFNLTESQLPYLVMEYVEGRDLYSLGDSTLWELLPVLRQICTGMDYAHREKLSAIKEDLEKALFDVDKALADLSQAIRMKPGRADYYQMRARVYEKLGKAGLAAQDREKMKIDDFTLKF